MKMKWKKSQEHHQGNKKIPTRYLESSVPEFEEESSSEEESSGDENSKCKICDKKKAPQTKYKKGKDTWIGCDICECWFHVEY